VFSRYVEQLLSNAIDAVVLTRVAAEAYAPAFVPATLQAQGITPPSGNHDEVHRARVVVSFDEAASDSVVPGATKGTWKMRR
jgi:hypothetical protein